MLAVPRILFPLLNRCVGPSFVWLALLDRWNCSRFIEGGIRMVESGVILLYN
jgi:hypothetical protein